MQTILDEVVELVLGLKGTPSGEHGDGIVRSPYVRQVYGDEVYGVFSEIKDAFDPTGIINPGKKVVSKAEGGGVARNLRYGPNYYTHEQSPHLHFPAGEYEREIEKCHGCAQCRSLVGTTMCPTYKATRREHASPRAKANLLRNIISGRLDPTASYVADATKDDHRLLHRVRHVRARVPVERQHPQADARSQGTLPLGPARPRRRPTCCWATPPVSRRVDAWSARWPTGW